MEKSDAHISPDHSIHFWKKKKKHIFHNLLTIQFTFLFPILYLVEFISFFFLDYIIFLVSQSALSPPMPPYDITYYIYMLPKTIEGTDWMK
jgi:hypothetical protein